MSFVPALSGKGLAFHPLLLKTTPSWPFRRAGSRGKVLVCLSVKYIVVQGTQANIYPNASRKCSQRNPIINYIVISQFI